MRTRCASILTLVAMIGLTLAARRASGQIMSVVDSPHDLSAGSRAEVRAVREEQVCIFCHAPHNASPVGALWNRSLSPQAYTVYTSQSLAAKPGQPTGASKLCLSCHDGTIAIGSLLGRSTPVQMTGGVTTLSQGASNLGTDLRDDHPISFRFDSTLVNRGTKLRDPSGLPHQIRLDNNRELQCTSCHDAHNNAFGKFLVMRNSSSELCLSCHQMGQTDITGHGQCSDCHQSHSAPSGAYLLRKSNVSETCLTCHSGTTPHASNIAADMKKAYVHDTASSVDPAAPANQVATCTSCHDPHTMTHGAGRAAASGQGSNSASFGRFGLISGVSASGAPMKVATAEHEVCFKCHAEGNTRPPAVARRLAQNNVRLQFSPSAISLHPVGTQGRSSQVPSLKPGWSTASTMRCTDCHGSDSGTSPGVHGSNIPSLLVARYETADRTSESATAYALCYKCHDRGSILDNRSFPGHRQHIVDQRTPCSVCHDSHGIPASQGTVTGNSHLINFASATVLPDRVTGRLEYRDSGGMTGECFLTCHGVDHSPKRYQAGFAPGLLQVPARPGPR
ncbi:MAG: cytochrome c3 family protein [Planctomycetota bacterium]